MEKEIDWIKIKKFSWNWNGKSKSEKWIKKENFRYIVNIWEIEIV